MAANVTQYSNVNRCRQTLARCNNDIARAAAELKADKLIDMGLVNDRPRALHALAKAGGDLNAAAEALLMQHTA